MVENFLDIDPSLKIIRKVDALFEGFSLELFTVEITATQEHKFMVEDAEVEQELMEVRNELLESRVSFGVHHIVCDSCQIRAKLGYIFCKSWLYICVKLFDNFLSFAVDNDHR